MSAISAKDVMALRQRTGLGMMDCKAALTETGGDMAKAEELLRTKLKGKMDTRTDRPASEGILAIAEAPDHTSVAMIEINTETDFTARNEKTGAAAKQIASLALGGGAGNVAVNPQITQLVDDLRITTGENISYRRGVKLAGGYCGHYLHHDNKKGVIIQFSGPVDKETVSGICQHITFADPQGVTDADIPADTLAKVRADAKQEAIESGKNPDIAEKMVEGKVRKYLGEVTLLNQKYVKDPEGKKAVKDVLPKGVTVQRFVRYIVGA